MSGIGGAVRSFCAEAEAEPDNFGRRLHPRYWLAYDSRANVRDATMPVAFCAANHRHSIFCIVPPHILREIAKRGDAAHRQTALDATGWRLQEQHEADRERHTSGRAGETGTAWSIEPGCSFRVSRVYRCNTAPPPIGLLGLRPKDFYCRCLEISLARPRPPRRQLPANPPACSAKPRRCAPT